MVFRPPSRRYYQPRRRLFFSRAPSLSFVGLSGNQPASTGTIAAKQTLFRSLAGAQPASTGTIAARQSLFRSLAGNQPNATGASSPKQTLLRALAGVQPAATGTLTGFGATIGGTLADGGFDSEIVAGGETITIRLIGTTWVP